jgi:hypothetical protein
MAACAHAVADAFDVQIRAGQSDVPDAHLEALRCSLGEQPWHSAAAERGLERKVLALLDRSLE